MTKSKTRILTPVLPGPPLSRRARKVAENGRLSSMSTTAWRGTRWKPSRPCWKAQMIPPVKSGLQHSRSSQQCPDTALQSQAMIVRRNVIFQSTAFNTSEPKDYFINDCCYGDDFARWIMEQLRARGIHT